MALAALLIALALIGCCAIITRHTVVEAGMQRDTWHARWTTAAAQVVELAARPSCEELAAVQAQLDEALAPPPLDPQLAADLMAEVKVEPLITGLPETTTTVWAQRCCQHCGGLHTRACPRVRSISYSSDGKPSQVDFWPDGRWPTDGVLWLDEVIAAAALATDAEEVSGQK